MNATAINRAVKLGLLLILLMIVFFVNVHALSKEVGADIVVRTSYREIGRMNVELPPITGATTGEGITVENTKVTLTHPAKHWHGHWDAGQYRLPESGRIVLRAEVKGARP